MGKILISGATGYIGRNVLRELLQSTQDQFLVPVRAASVGEFEARKAAFLKNFADSSRMSVIHSNLLSLPEKLFEHQSELTGIVHSAAVTAFNVPEDVANEVNRDASLRLFEFAQNCPNLNQLLYVSTVYTSGLKSGAVTEDFTNKPDFANHYERSKWEVEDALRTRFENLPWKIGRVATILCDDHSGAVTQQNAIHNTLKLFYYGLISLVPGQKETPVYLVEGDFVTQALAKIYLNGQSQSIFHVCHDREQAIPLQEFIDLAFEEFERDENFKARRLMKPLMTDEGSFTTLVQNLQHFGGAVLNQGLSSVAPFGRQLYVAKDIQNTKMVGLLGTRPNPDMRSLVRKTIQFLMKTKFAKAKVE